MLVNANTVLQASSFSLVPYRIEHVLKYHEWMQDPFLLETTCSEPLTLDQEYEMQQSWQSDPKKLTFIITNNFILIGDVNLYFNEIDDDKCAEIEIMIAEPEFRGKGMGKNVLKVFIDYSVKTLQVAKFRAIIGLENYSSLELFKKLGFVKVSESAIFQQATLESDGTCTSDVPVYEKLCVGCTTGT
jgi:RimJ/RimL family protein N-acetyltransferase